MVLSDNIRGAALMAISMAAFVSNDTLVKLVSSDLGLFQILFLRGIMATAALIVIAHFRGQLFVSLERRDIGVMALRLIGEIGATMSFLTALFNMPLANVTAILQALPLAVTLGAAVFLRESVGWRRLSAIAIGFTGVLIIVRPGTEGFNSFATFALLSVGFVVLRDLSTRRLGSKVPSIFAALMTSIAVTTIGALAVPFSDWHPVQAPQLTALAGSTVFLVIGYLSSVMTMRVGEIAFVAPFRYTAMIWAILLGFLVFGQFPDNWTLLGSAVVIAMGLYSFYRERVRHRLIVAPRHARMP
ncbi:DMT family transporter [Pacificispira spongiicola]|uniref:DMT family transporter n=1 Tax=Pacificispira spongiicola TaxID=2729598 RepID=UPI001D0CC082|nr:DMT family transporter [Pacificispira spongiicola]